MDKEQSNVNLSSEDEEILNQKLPSHATSVEQDVTEKEATDTVKVLRPTLTILMDLFLVALLFADFQNLLTLELFLYVHVPISQFVSLPGK